MLTGSVFPLRPRRFMIWVQIREVISMSKQHKQLKPQRWMRLDLIFTIMQKASFSIYTHSKILARLWRGTKSEDILPWKISQMIKKTVPFRKSIIKYCALIIYLRVWRKVNGNWDNNWIRISEERERQCRTNTRVKRNKYIQKRNPRTIWEKAFRIKDKNRVHKVYQFHQNRATIPYDGR